MLTAALHETANTAIIAAVVVFNTLTGVVQEVRADHAVAALADLTPATSQVRRDGVVTTVPAEDLVPGDEVLLAAGDLVPGDGELTTARDLEVDESTMTGESLPVPRASGDPVTGGTLVTRGRGVVTLTRTGPDSGLGRLAALIDAAPVRATPLQTRLTQVSRVLVVLVVALTAVVVVIGLAQGRSLADMAVLGVSLAVAAVPESLPAVVAVALALGAHRMAARKAVVRRLPAVETLGSVTVIATDKTGTITQGRMVAERVWTPDADHVLDGDGDLAVGPGVARLLRDVVLCNDARLPGPAGDGPSLGDPLEVALLVLADRAGQAPEDVEQVVATDRRGGLRRRHPADGDHPPCRRRRGAHRLQGRPGGGARPRRARSRRTSCGRRGRRARGRGVPRDRRRRPGRRARGSRARGTRWPAWSPSTTRPGPTPRPWWRRAGGPASVSCS